MCESRKKSEPIHLADIEQLGLLVFYFITRRYWKSATMVFFLWLILGIFLIVFLPKSYVAETTILPADFLGGTGGGLSGVAAAASQFGVNLNGSQGDLSASFPEIAVSRKVLERTLRRLERSADEKERGYFQLLAGGEGPRDHLLNQGTGKLRKSLSISTSKNTGLTSISVMAESGDLAATLANLVVAELDTFLRESRMALALDSTHFIQARMEEVELDLQQSEEALLVFRKENRDFSSPELLLEFERLQREVRINESLYLTLNSQNELARIESAKNSPMFKILDEAEIPGRPGSPNPPLILVLVIIAGFLSAVFVASARDYWVMMAPKIAPREAED